jgi:hypothetical protein
MVFTLAEALLNEQLTKNSCLSIILIKKSLCPVLKVSTSLTAKAMLFTFLP